jgi:hypothetical protein
MLRGILLKQVHIQSYYMPSILHYVRLNRKFYFTTLRLTRNLLELTLYSFQSRNMEIYGKIIEMKVNILT